MHQSSHQTTKLPQKLLDELRLDNASTGRCKRKGPRDRKERRKVGRIEKKERRIRPNAERYTRIRQLPVRSIDHTSFEASPGSGSSESEYKPVRTVAESGQFLKTPKPGKSTKSAEKHPEEPVRPQIPKRLRAQLAADDVEIEALERALGIKGKKLPKSFEDDGLEDLLDGLRNPLNVGIPLTGKRQRTGEQDWLEQKREKARKLHNTSDNVEEPSSSESRDTLSEGLDRDGSILADETNPRSEELPFDSFDSGSEVAAGKRSQIRENPYVAPSVSASTSTKSVRPLTRPVPAGEAEALTRLRRQLQGLLNRLSEANILSILDEVERLYRDNPRQHVATTLIDLLIGLLCDPTSLQDTFIILHAGFIAAIYKVVGTDFGAQLVQRVVEEFDRIYTNVVRSGSNGKKLTNLISLIAELYNFQVISSRLVYDCVQLFLQDLSETNTELLLKVIRSSGHQLRQDDPSSLKEIVLLLQPAIAKIGTENLSVRTRFMIETINNLKNNRMKTGLAASSIASEHTLRMKKTIGSLNTRSIRASEPLRIGLKDIRETEKRGKWWLVGASYKDENFVDEIEGSHTGRLDADPENGISSTTPGAPDLLEIAKAHRMNTDVRRSIFITIMSSTDYRDAYLRLLKLRLKKTQKLEIPKVLIHCAGAENVYNPFYTLISRRLCSDRKMKMAFQFSLWDLFKEMDEGDDRTEDEHGDGETDGLGMGETVNLAKLFGMLVAEGGLGLGILKTLNFAYLLPKTQTFVELFFIALFAHSRREMEDERNEKAIMDMFLKLQDFPELVTGLQHFLKRVVRKTNVAGSKQDRATVQWGCRVANDALVALLSTKAVEE